MIEVRPETADDRDAVWSLLAAAFPTPDEADLVNRLHADGDVVYSLVAARDGVVVGHVLFSRMTAPFRALGLAPVSTAAATAGRGSPRG